MWMLFKSVNHNSELTGTAATLEPSPRAPRAVANPTVPDRARSTLAHQSSTSLTGTQLTLTEHVSHLEMSFCVTGLV